MSTELQPYKDERPIVMKGGLVHWVLPVTWEKISELLATQTAHRFIRISELNITINTAEVEGTYTMEQYQDLCKVKQGMWQCEYRNWHNKGKRECECAREWRQKQAEEERKKKEAEDNRPLTDEERKANAEAFRKMSEKAALDGKPDSIFRQAYMKGNRSGKVIRRSTIAEWEKEKKQKADTAGLAIDENA